MKKIEEIGLKNRLWPSFLFANHKKIHCFNDHNWTNAIYSILFLIRFYKFCVCDNCESVMGIPMPAASETLFVQQANLYMEEIKTMCGREERYLKTKVLFEYMAQNLVYFQISEKYVRFRHFFRDKIQEWSSTGNQFEQQIARDFGWIVEEICNDNK